MKKTTPKNMANLRFSLEVFLKSVQSDFYKGKEVRISGIFQTLNTYIKKSNIYLKLLFLLL